MWCDDLFAGRFGVGVYVFLFGLFRVVMGGCVAYIGFGVRRLCLCLWLLAWFGVNLIAGLSLIVLVF